MIASVFGGDETKIDPSSCVVAKLSFVVPLQGLILSQKGG